MQGVFNEMMLGDRPPPPKLPKYDPNEEAPMWDWERLRWNMPVDKGSKPWTAIGDRPESPDDPDWRGVIRNRVIEYPMPEAYKFGKPIDPKYFWFDTPDYADPFKKLGYSLRWFSWTGALACSVRAMIEGTKFTLANNFQLGRKLFLPWVFSGMAASATVMILANMRGKKDDYYNYAAAGFVMGCILGRKDHVRFFKYTIFTVPAAILVKHNAEINGELYPQFNFRLTNMSLSGQTAENGVASGDYRFGFRGSYGEPGRDVRTFAR